MKKLAWLFFFLSSFSIALSSDPVSYSITKYTINGAGRSSGGGYTLEGTISYPITGLSSAPNRTHVQGGFFYNTPPVISVAQTTAIVKISSSSTVTLTIRDAELATSSLIITAQSSNQAIISNANITQQGATSASVTMVIAAAANVVPGTTCIVTFVVSDGVYTASTSLTIRVPVPPVLATIASPQVAFRNLVTTVSFTVTDQDTPLNQLQFSLSSSDQSIVSNFGLNVAASSSANRQLFIQPQNTTGATFITVQASDEFSTTSQTFQLNVLDINTPQQVPTGASIQPAIWQLAFNGTTDYIEVTNPTTPAELGITGALTVEAWVYLYSASGAQSVVEKWSQTPSNQGGYALRIDASRRVQFALYGSSGTVVGAVTGNTQLELNKWYQIAGVYDGTDVRVYVNGVVDGSPTNVSTPPTAGSSKLRIAASGNGTVPNSGFLAGQIDEVRIWNVARTGRSINSDLFRNMIGSSNLVGYWQFNEGSGHTAFDASGLQNNGTLLPASPTFGPSSAPFATVITAMTTELTGIWNIQPSTSSSILTLTSATIPSSTNGVITFGHNNFPINYNSSDVSGDLVWRLDRVWRIEKQGTPTTGLRFDLSSFIINDPSQLRVLVDTDGFFANGALQLTGTYNAATKVFTVTDGQDLPNGAYVTICSKCATCQ